MSSYAYGEPVTLTLTAADGTTANLADYAEVVLTIVQPDGTSLVKKKTDATLTANPYVFAPTQTGRHVYYYVTTTPNGASDAQPFDVLAAGEAPLVSLADAKAQTNIDDTVDDDELRGFIDAATDVVESVIGPVRRSTVTESPRPFYDDGKWKILLNNAPVDLSTVTVTEWNGTTSQAIAYEPFASTNPFTSYGWDADDNGESGIIYRTSDGYPSTWGGRVSVTYTAGRSEVPAAIRMAALLLIEHAWEQTQRGGADLPLQNPEGVPDVSYGPDRRSLAMQYLAPYRKAPAVA